MTDPVVTIEVENLVQVVAVETAPLVAVVDIEVPAPAAIIEVVTEGPPGPTGPLGNVAVSVDPPASPFVNDLWVPIPP